MTLDLPLEYNKLDWIEKKKVREQYIKLQKNQCWFCGKNLYSKVPEFITDFYDDINWNLFPENFLKYPIHLQHNHDTGLTEGAVHAYCNAVLWQYFKR